MKRIALWLSAASVVASMTFGAQAQDRVVNIYNWSDYIDKKILEDFTKETGIKTVYDVYDSNEMLETKLLAGGSGYDIVVPSANFLARQIEAGVYQKLDKSKLPNLSNMWDFISNHVAQYDPGNEYSVNWMWGTVGIGYNERMVAALIGDQPITGWDAVFDPAKLSKLADCGVTFLDSPADIIPAALHYLKLDPSSAKKEDLAKAEAILLSIRPFIRKFHSSEYIESLANGDICLAVGFSGDISQAASRAAQADQGVVIRYVIPDDTAQLWFDQIAIPADAPHVEDAHILINYLMRPDIAARATNYVLYPNGNKASQGQINPEILNDKLIYPDKKVLDQLYTSKPYDRPSQRLITRLWTKVVTGQ